MTIIHWQKWRKSLAAHRRQMVFCAGAIALGGCAAAIPVAGDVAGTAIDKTGEAVRAGKVESFQPVTLDEAIAITRRVTANLNLTLEKEEKHPEQLKLLYHDDRKQPIVITLVRRTSGSTQLRVDVGLFGEGGMGELVMHQILAEMPGHAGAATQK